MKVLKLVRNEFGKNFLLRFFVILLKLIQFANVFGLPNLFKKTYVMDKIYEKIIIKKFCK